MDEDDERLMEHRLLAHARAQFEAGDFEGAVQTCNEIAPAALTRADKKRAELARRRA